METIIFKAPDGTKARLKRINPNLSALLRNQVEKLFTHRAGGSAFDKAASLCGSLKGTPRNASTDKAYLKQYAKTRIH